MDIATLRETMGPDWTFVSEDGTFRAFATIGGNVVHKNMDEQLVYDLVTAYVATLEELKAKAPYGDTVGFDIPCKACAVPIHSNTTLARRVHGKMPAMKLMLALWTAEQT